MSRPISGALLARLRPKMGIPITELLFTIRICPPNRLSRASSVLQAVPRNVKMHSCWKGPHVPACACRLLNVRTSAGTFGVQPEEPGGIRQGNEVRNSRCSTTCVTINTHTDPPCGMFPACNWRNSGSDAACRREDASQENIHEVL